MLVSVSVTMDRIASVLFLTVLCHCQARILDSPDRNNEISRRSSPGRHVRSLDLQAHRYIEVMLVADDTVVKFHGKDLVQQYLLTQMNIVNNVYHHDSLGVEINVIVTKIMYVSQELAESLVTANDGKRTLDNFCTWANRQRPSDYMDPENFDIAIFITRMDFGPAGYAPVNGMCQQRRSCAVNKDDGISSAYVIAHEMGHVLGMGHDGVSNDCDVDPVDGKLMAHTVLSNYESHYWSNCSKASLMLQLPGFHCLTNKPSTDTKTWPKISEPYGQSWSLDDQCRQEFGEDYSLCTTFNLDPCVHLWCSVPYNETLCKSKRGPPLPGTKCGENRWCMDSQCQYQSDVARDGGWTTWNEWQPCSQTCGVGVQFRYRFCSNPRPAHGGKDCDGEREQNQLCNTSPCKVLTDSRAVQCHLYNTKYFVGNMRHHWMPLENKNSSRRCKLTCVSKETGDVFVTENDVIDGTFCSYDTTDNICIKGRCQKSGCDGDINKQTDHCGVCGGSGQSCTRITERFSKTLARKQYHSLVILPPQSRSIRIKEMKGSPYLAHFFAVKDHATGEYLLSGDGKQTPSADIVIYGAKFSYNSKGLESLIAEGPLLAPLEIMVYSFSDKLEADITYEYITAKQNVNSSLQYLWKLKGWTDCTEVCGGGEQIQDYQCIDKYSEEAVDKEYCNLVSTPQASSRICNIRPCYPNQFQWKKDAWGQCEVSTCGQTGRQFRNVDCITMTQVSLKWTSQAVDHRYCLHKEPSPEAQRSCVGPPCLTSWNVGNWSQCSVSCDVGVQSRRVYCNHPQDTRNRYTCNERRPVDTRSCLIQLCDDKTTTTTTTEESELVDSSGEVKSNMDQRQNTKFPTKTKVLENVVIKGTETGEEINLGNSPGETFTVRKTVEPPLIDEQQNDEVMVTTPNYVIASTETMEDDEYDIVDPIEATVTTQLTTTEVISTTTTSIPPTTVTQIVEPISVCSKDKSFFCKMGVTNDSCDLPLYKKYCCHSCALLR